MVEWVSLIAEEGESVTKKVEYTDIYCVDRWGCVNNDVPLYIDEVSEMDNVTCFNCGEMGHRINDCSLPKDEDFIQDMFDNQKAFKNTVLRSCAGQLLKLW